MKLPEFVVIGAMKAGSTTVYEDLRGCPGVFVPEKELDTLSDPDLDRAGYAALFTGAREGQVAGEVSATYAKLPETTGVAERAGRLLGTEFRVVYLVRDPVDRTASHHFHRLSRRTIDASVDVAVRADHRLIDYSRYGMQLEPWLDVVGPDRVHLVHFERYVADRAAGLAALLAFLGVTDAAPAGEPRSVHNRTEGRHVAVGARGRIARSGVYRRYVRPRLPESARRRLAEAVLPTAPPRPAPPSEETVELVLDRTAADCARLVEVFGPDAPQWDAAATRARYAQLRADRLASQ